MIAAVTSPFAGGEIRLRLSSFLGRSADLGPVVQSVMHVDARDLAFTEAADGLRLAQLEVMAMTFGDNGQVAEHYSRGYTVRLTAERYAQALQTGFVYNLRMPVKRRGPISCGSHCATLAPIASARPASSSTCRIWASDS